jgi:hypothetical protein
MGRGQQQQQQASRPYSGREAAHRGGVISGRLLLRMGL